jgi:hypothetical protein
MEVYDVWIYRDEAQLGYDPTNGADITGFGVEALDGSIGKVDKSNDDVGQSYVIVNTGPWILGKTVMLPAGVIDRIDAEEEKIWVNRTKDQIKDAPEYDDTMADNPDYRGDIASYYGAGGPGYRDWDDSR